jgi:hypothetical protein
VIRDQGSAEDDRKCELGSDSIETIITTNLIEEAFGIMRPSNRGEFDKANLLREPLVVMIWTYAVDFCQWGVRPANIYSAKITALCVT